MRKHTSCIKVALMSLWKTTECSKYDTNGPLRQPWVGAENPPHCPCQPIKISWSLWLQPRVIFFSQVGFGSESCAEIGSEDVVSGVFASGCHVTLEDVHHTFRNLKIAFLASVFASSSVRVMTEGLLRSLPLMSRICSCAKPCRLPSYCSALRHETERESQTC